MADTTQANVELIAPALAAGVSDDLWTLILADVALEIPTGYLCSDDYQEIVQRYLAAHRLTLITGAGMTGGSSSVAGFNEREKVADVEIEYGTVTDMSDGGLERTQYGSEYKRLYLKYRRITMA